ncbi:hypothetical protein BSKO_02832 [Bryopsis sp. KO-2023]|nr:hypothetical protein BSKO_02832 [Bryopsis sp. KO-2023]
MSCATLGRGDDMRKVQYSDLSIEKLPDFSPRPMTILNITKHIGKKNDTGVKEHLSLAPHRDPLVCGVVALSLLLVWREHHLKRDPPNAFCPRRSWYGWYLFQGSSPTTEMDYNVHLEGAKRALKAVQFSTTHPTHCPRISGANELRKAGADNGVVRSMLLHSRRDDELSYLHTPPPEGLFIMAGFRGGEHDMFRMDVDPGDYFPTMTGSIFPDLETQLESKRRHNQSYTAAFKDVSGERYLEAKLFLRRIFWANLPALHDRYPQHPIFEIPELRMHEQDFLSWKVLQSTYLQNMGCSTEVQPHDDLAAAALSLALAAVQRATSSGNPNLAHPTTFVLHIVASSINKFAEP